MKAKQVEYNNIKFRSILECRHYMLMVEMFRWKVEYEPVVEGLYGWLPDFLIRANSMEGKDRPTEKPICDILVEVKPIRDFEEWISHPDFNKIKKSGIEKTIVPYDFLVIGATPFLEDQDHKPAYGFYCPLGTYRKMNNKKPFTADMAYEKDMYSIDKEGPFSTDLIMKEIDKNFVELHETNFLNDTSLYPAGLEYGDFKMHNYYVDISSACKNNNFYNARYKGSSRFCIEQSWNEISSEKRWSPIK
jgi:hypothetical protein